MASNDSELKSEVRLFTQYSTAILDSDDLDSVVSSAKRHIRSKKDISDSNFDWYSNVHREDALFWYTCLFAKVATGELDGQDVQVGAIDISSKSAQEGDEATIWVKNARDAVRRIDGGSDLENEFGIRSTSREDRVYDEDEATGTEL